MYKNNDIQTRGGKIFVSEIFFKGLNYFDISTTKDSYKLKQYTKKQN